MLPSLSGLNGLSGLFVPGGGGGGPTPPSNPWLTALSVASLPFTRRAFIIVPPPPTAPSITTISPTSALVNSTGNSITVNGANFNNGTSAIHWGASALTTSFINSGQLTAPVPDSDFLTAGTVSIRVVDSVSGTSNTATFTINNPVPSLLTVTPNTAVAGAPDTPITLVGSNFENVSVIQFNNINLATTFTDTSHVSATVPAADLTVAGTYNVDVVNPTPGGGTSNILPFSVGQFPAPRVVVAPPGSPSLPSFAVAYSPGVAAITPSSSAPVITTGTPIAAPGQSVTLFGFQFTNTTTFSHYDGTVGNLTYDGVTTGIFHLDNPNDIASAIVPNNGKPNAMRMIWAQTVSGFSYPFMVNKTTLKWTSTSANAWPYQLDNLSCNGDTVRVYGVNLAFSWAMSTSSVSIGVAAGKVWNIGTGRTFYNGQTVYIADRVTPRNSMIGTVTAYSGGNLTVTTTAATGSGTSNDWVITGDSGVWLVPSGVPGSAQYVTPTFVDQYRVEFTMPTIFSGNTSNSNKTIAATASVTFTTVTPHGWTVGQRVYIAPGITSGGLATGYMVGVLLAGSSGSTAIFSVAAADVHGSNSTANWILCPQIDIYVHNGHGDIYGWDGPVPTYIVQAYGYGTVTTMSSHGCFPAVASTTSNTHPVATGGNMSWTIGSNPGFAGGQTIYALDQVRYAGLITAISGTSAQVPTITSANHGLVTGQLVIVSGCFRTGGNPHGYNPNGAYIVTVVDANTFSLNGTTNNGTFDVANSPAASWTSQYSTYIAGTFVSLIGNVLTINVTAFLGAGTSANWNLGIDNRANMVASISAAVASGISSTVQEDVGGTFYFGGATQTLTGNFNAGVYLQGKGQTTTIFKPINIGGSWPKGFFVGGPSSKVSDMTFYHDGIINTAQVEFCKYDNVTAVSPYLYQSFGGSKKMWAQNCICKGGGGNGGVNWYNIISSPFVDHTDFHNTNEAASGFREDIPLNAHFAYNRGFDYHSSSSSTTLTYATGSTGNVTLDLDTNFHFGDYVIFKSQTTMGNYLVGTVSSYDPNTKILIANILAFSGAGTDNSWYVAGWDLYRGVGRLAIYNPKSYNTYNAYNQTQLLGESAAALSDQGDAGEQILWEGGTSDQTGLLTTPSQTSTPTWTNQITMTGSKNHAYSYIQDQAQVIAGTGLGQYCNVIGDAWPTLTLDRQIFVDNTSKVTVGPGCEGAILTNNNQQGTGPSEYLPFFIGSNSSSQGFEMFCGSGNTIVDYCNWHHMSAFGFSLYATSNANQGVMCCYNILVQNTRIDTIGNPLGALSTDGQTFAARIFPNPAVKGETFTMAGVTLNNVAITNSKGGISVVEFGGPLTDPFGFIMISNCSGGGSTPSKYAYQGFHKFSGGTQTVDMYNNSFTGPNNAGSAGIMCVAPAGTGPASTGVAFIFGVSGGGAPNTTYPNSQFTGYVS